MSKQIALTFDDGPNVTTTVQVLEKLKKYNVRASFFLIADNITEESAKVARQAFDMGCEINNHSKTHSHMPELDAETIRMEIEYTDEKIIGITGQKPAFFRPPYIDVNNVMVENIDKPFICGINGLDWENDVSAQRRAEMILGKVADGNIILMHDTEGNDKTVEALDLIIPELLARGYEFLTVSDLFKSKGITPGVHNGVVYSDVLQTRRFDE